MAEPEKIIPITPDTGANLMKLPANLEAEAAFLGAVLYHHLGFWSVLPFMLTVLYLASLAFRQQPI